MTEQLWTELYRPGVWRDLWFVWEGKPLLLADPQHVKDPAERAFFTYRRPSVVMAGRIRERRCLPQFCPAVPA